MKKIIKEITKIGEKLAEEITAIILDNSLMEIEINPSDKQVTINLCNEHDENINQTIELPHNPCSKTVIESKYQNDVYFYYNNDFWYGKEGTFLEVKKLKDTTFLKEELPKITELLIKYGELFQEIYSQYEENEIDCETIYF